TRPMSGPLLARNAAPVARRRSRWKRKSRNAARQGRAGPGERVGLAAAAERTAAGTAVAATAAATTAFALTRLAHLDRTAVQVVAVEVSDRLLRLVRRAHLDEAETA